jgi:hypothetical protein
MSLLRSLSVSLAVLLAASGASGASLMVSGGQLVGALNVDVSGNLYDVEFLEGTCVSFFDGCDSAADFPFSDATETTLAAQALLDQVFLDVEAGSFDSDPGLTFGCTAGSTSCNAMTPYTFTPSLVSVIGARNRSPSAGSDAPAGSTFDKSSD